MNRVQAAPTRFARLVAASIAAASCGRELAASPVRKSNLNPSRVKAASTHVRSKLTNLGQRGSVFDWTLGSTIRVGVREHLEQLRLAHVGPDGSAQAVQGRLVVACVEIDQ